MIFLDWTVHWRERESGIVYFCRSFLVLDQLLIRSRGVDSGNHKKISNFRYFISKRPNRPLRDYSHSQEQETMGGRKPVQKTRFPALWKLVLEGNLSKVRDFLL